jgi:TetR/AcrR family transcriptional regulator
VLDVASGKQQQILSGALRTFGRYGYRRTSMELIAKAADVSRPALYQYFRGKEDVFRAMAGQMLDGLIAAAELAEQADGSVSERLFGVLSVKLEFVVGTVDVQYRTEILNDAEQIAGDLLTAFKDQWLSVIERCLASSSDELDLVGTVLSAHDTACLLLDAVVGIVQEDADPNTLNKRLRDLVDLTARGLSSHRA